MSTAPATDAVSLYEAFRRRWALEETYMALTRYHGIGALPANWLGVACARVHTLCFAYTLRWLCRQQA